jgi:hypothetical protein
MHAADASHLKKITSISLARNNIQAFIKITGRWRNKPAEILLLKSKGAKQENIFRDKTNNPGEKSKNVCLDEIT